VWPWMTKQVIAGMKNSLSKGQKGGGVAQPRAGAYTRSLTAQLDP